MRRRDGEIEFDLPPGDAWREDKIGGDTGFWVKVTAQMNFGGLRIAESEVCQSPHSNTVSKMTVTGSTRSGVSIRSAGRNVIQDSVIEASKMFGVTSGSSLSAQPSRA